MFDKQTVEKFRGDFAKAVAELEKTYGASISLGNIRYEPNSFRSTLTVTANNAKPAGLPPIGKKFIFKNHSYTVTGYDLGRRSTKVVQIIRDDGKRMICAPSLVK